MPVTSVSYSSSKWIFISVFFGFYSYDLKIYIISCCLGENSITHLELVTPAHILLLLRVMCCTQFHQDADVDFITSHTMTICLLTLLQELSAAKKSNYLGKKKT